MLLIAYVDCAVSEYPSGARFNFGEEFFENNVETERALGNLTDTHILVGVYEAWVGVKPQDDRRTRLSFERFLS